MCGWSREIGQCGHEIDESDREWVKCQESEGEEDCFLDGHFEADRLIDKNCCSCEGHRWYRQFVNSQEWEEDSQIGDKLSPIWEEFTDEMEIYAEDAKRERRERTERKEREKRVNVRDKEQEREKRERESIEDLLEDMELNEPEDFFSEQAVCEEAECLT